MKHRLFENNFTIFLKKQNIVFCIIGMILGSLITGGIGAIAVTLAADQITYTPDDNQFNVDNVKEAVDKLYELSSNITPMAYITLPKISGSVTNNNQKYSATDIPGYENLTASDFVYFITKANAWMRNDNVVQFTDTISTTPKVSYESTTGIVSVTGTYKLSTNNPAYGTVAAYADGELRYYYKVS